MPRSRNPSPINDSQTHLNNETIVESAILLPLRILRFSASVLIICHGVRDACLRSFFATQSRADT